MRERISAIIIKDKKILLVTGYDESFYWTPGGKVEPGESHKEAMKRELKEEISVKLVEMRPYCAYKATNETTGQPQKVHCYLVEIKGTPSQKAELTKSMWCSSQDILTGKTKVSKRISSQLLPRLMKDKIL